MALGDLIEVETLRDPGIAGWVIDDLVLLEGEYREMDAFVRRLFEHVFRSNFVFGTIGGRFY